MVKRRRIANDLYPSEKLLAAVLRRYVNFEGVTLEPFAGNGDIAQAFPNCVTNDLYQSSVIKPDYMLDAFRDTLYEIVEPDNVVTNPPYAVSTPNPRTAVDAVKIALDHAKSKVAMLLRSSFLEPTEDRYSLLRENQRYMSHLIILNPRPRFRADTNGSDNVTSDWLVWDKNHHGLGTQIIYGRGWR